MTIFYLVRHGQSTWNAERRWQGQANPPLSDLGRQQAFEASQHVGQVDLVVSSPQMRALQTASILAESIGVGPIITVDDLRERHAGSWSGLTIEEIEERYPGYLESGKRPDDYEADDDLEQRVLAALNRLAGDYPDAEILAVCHGGVIACIEQTFGRHDGRVPNLGGRILHAGPTSWELHDELNLAPSQVSGGSPDRHDSDRL